MSLKKIILFCLTFSLLLSRGYSTDYDLGYSLISDRTKLPILSPTLSDRKTQKIKLENELEVYLISDPMAEQSGAMLSVKAGSWDDPLEHPGLAHFLEHMLFLGTLKYPKESEYEKFITEHGGQSNAFTTNNSTNFLFTVSPNVFSEALARFSSFFKEPLFNSSGVARELQAIDQEYAKNLEEDSIRQIYVLKEFATPGHPYHNFNMGNSETLANATRETLENWFNNHYSSNLMKLVVYSAEPLDKMADLVVKDFSAIPNNRRQSFTSTDPAYKNEQDKKFVYIEPIKDKRSLAIVWELPTKFSHMKETQPETIISYILGHEGEKSLLAQLKREKLAENLSCGGTKLGDDLTLFFIQIELTNEGLSDMDQVITRCFQAIKNLQSQGIPSYLFDEIQRMASLEYQYQSRENEFMMLMEHAFQIQDEDISTYPEHSTIIQQFNPGNVQELLKMLTPQNAQYFVMAPSKLTGVKPEKKEKWLGVEYGIKSIPRDSVEKWKHVTAHTEIDLPAPNIFIPDDLKLVYEKFIPSERLIPEPITLVNDDKTRVYFAHDDKFGVPKISWSLNILTPSISMEDPNKIIFGDIYVSSLKEALNKISYPAKMAGLEYDVVRKNNGINIKIEGYSQNAARLLDEVLLTIKNYKPTMSSFQILKDSQLRKYHNFAKEKPLDQSVEIFKSVLYKEFVTAEEKATALRKATFKKYTEYVDNIFDKTYIEAMLYGNITEDQGKDLVSKLDNTFNRGVYLKEEQLKDGVIVLPKDQGPYFLESHTKSQGNAVLLAIENDTFSFKERAAQQILMQAIKEPFFAALRTQQQTGYLVHSFSEEVERKLFNIFAVQSNTHDVRDLLSRFEQFIEGYTQEIGKKELLEHQFENIKEALIIKYGEPAKNTSKMGELLSTLAFEYDGDFGWIHKRLEAFHDLTYNEFLTIAKNFIGRNNKQRLAILLKGEIPQGNDFSYTRARTWNMIRKVSQYEYRENGS